MIVEKHLVDSEARFTLEYWPLRELYKFRSKNISKTQMIWIKKRAVIDSDGELYNPRTLIMNILN